MSDLAKTLASEADFQQSAGHRVAKQPRYGSVRKRRFFKAVPAAALALGIVMIPTAASADVIALGPSDLFGRTKMYYSAPHYKSANGHVTIRTTGFIQVTCPNGCYNGINTGLRNQPGADEDTNFPSSPVEVSVTYHNIRNNSDNFGAGTYYFNAMNCCTPDANAKWTGRSGGW